ncbi:MAG: type I DNA topoisomerase [Clostridiales Family XIII bacterium]|jgi:DNA topoisomerase-1|nr:type I DNA topoisomerase [Clostridiales Family XIII bacterium]
MASKATDSKALVIVESPSKAKTIGKFLGKRYKVVASVGHVRDLPKSKLGIEKENNFEPAYINIRGKGDVIRELKKEAKGATKVFLATDPDREGEAISWHIAHLLGLSPDQPNRIEFNEITKEAVINAVKKPRAINQNLVDAQQARRVLDRLVGYEISPLLWRKIRRGLSAGRVQSAALKIICDREKEIQAFIPKEYWNITVSLAKQQGDRKAFSARLIEKAGEKLTVESKLQADEVLADLEKGGYYVSRVEKKERIRKPFAPFTTSSLQQDASVKLGFYTKRVMSVAQQLYEGVEIKGKGTVGLISYIRTDSVRISAEAEAMVRGYITANYPPEYLGNNQYTNKKKDVQDAHEAIRPSYVDLRPEDIKGSLTSDQYRLYKLIWSRFVASRMSPAVFDAVSADVKNGDYLFRATGSKLKFDGFLRVYQTNGDDDEGKMLPDIEQDEALEKRDLTAEQNFTQPPARFTEASLVKELEDKDIGRPSTYVPIIATLIDRKYILREKKTLKPTDLGFVVTELMENYFKEIVDTGFTASMEDRLDDIEVQGIDWHKVVSDFYAILDEELKVADREIERVELPVEITDEVCELCGKPMAIKHGPFGEFLACTGYPDCKNTKAIVKTIGVACPVCGKDIVARRSKRGRTFYGCSGYPECRQVYWNKPVDKKCPQCGALLMEKKTKAGDYACSNPECDYRE